MGAQRTLSHFTNDPFTRPSRSVPSPSRASSSPWSWTGAGEGGRSRSRPWLVSPCATGNTIAQREFSYRAT